MAALNENIDSVKRRIIDACQKRPPSLSQKITLVAVSKTKPATQIEEALALGLCDFGENYVQELEEKIKQVSSPQLHWHFIGHLQSNKAKNIVGKVFLIHGLDSLKLAKEIEKECLKKGIVQKALVQINLSKEESKGGISENEIEDFLKSLNEFEQLEIVGLMTLPPPTENPEESRPYFKKLREIKDALNSKKIYRSELTELSMGMTQDFEVAIEEGATIIRVGTAIFGSR